MNGRKGVHELTVDIKGPRLPLRSDVVVAVPQTRLIRSEHLYDAQLMCYCVCDHCQISRCDKPDFRARVFQNKVLLIKPWPDFAVN